MAEITKMWIADKKMREIMKYKPLDKIRVTEILVKQRTSSPTFYYHFKDKYDLVAWMFRRMPMEQISPPSCPPRRG